MHASVAAAAGEAAVGMAGSNGVALTLAPWSGRSRVESR